MLALTRDEKQVCVIVVPPSDKETIIEVQMVRIVKNPDTNRKAARLGFEAPPQVEVNRMEVHRRKHPTYVPKCWKRFDNTT